ncbi:putative NUDIX family NTP pyrophosphohydrolase [Edaphobacter aggregans]|uniref:Putative NUDIX family NTP pyrophosphohydrolase n=1 Tax=Edaphobacter aggregans TaxID=570835 RepID=A0A428MR42_9BACT|nr:NUDIX domain-containing protein [Edaphobacter aggregans]RSL19387.1 putative NUDIX family NTP pyrophosphohydrolase [Edaphobacter aggregans]
MAKRSAGLIVYRRRGDGLEVFLVHPGGPFWAKKDLGAWSIPKGEYEEGEDGLDAARREFWEETGFAVDGDFLEVGTIKQPGGKVVAAWAVAGEFDAALLRSNVFEMEWPPRSGLIQEFPEVDRGGWFSIEEARGRILKGQVGLLEMLCSVLR